MNGQQTTSTADNSDAARASLAEGLAGKYMTFKLANEEFGMEILKVREIIRLMDITRVPRTSDFIRGVINLRGKVHPVVDLRLKFGMDATEDTETTVIIVVQYNVGDHEIVSGILVDEVVEVLDIPADQIERPPSFGSGGSDADFILGVGKADIRVIFLLDIGRVLSVEGSQDRIALGIDSTGMEAGSAS